MSNNVSLQSGFALFFNCSLCNVLLGGWGDFRVLVCRRRRGKGERRRGGGAIERQRVRGCDSPLYLCLFLCVGVGEGVLHS